MSPPAVALAEVTVTFRLADGGAYPAVEGASLSVADGEFVAIVGPTGCGKSTLLNVAAGLIAPSSGRIDIFGAPLASLNRQAGYLFQAEALFPWKTALENVAIGLETAGVARAQARERAQACLTASASPTSARAIRTCCRAARGSAWASCRCSSAIPRSC
jgi:sulfonate transport system ATP-binding protein